MNTDTQPVIDAENPWPGLDAFDEAAETFFNGREHEATILRRLVLNAPLTVLFSASGLGKTSLIQAGLFPILRREQILPVRIRLDCRDRKSPLVNQLRSALEAQLSAWRVDAPPPTSEETLWQYLHRTSLELWSEKNQLLTPLFVLDQFEEVFTLGAENSSGVGELLVDLADLVENRIPLGIANAMKQDEAVSAGLNLDNQRYHILLSFREDFLPAIEGWKRLMPSIQRNRLRLLPMSSEQAFRAVHDTAPGLVDEQTALRIVHFVAAAQDDQLGKTSTIAGNGEGFSVEPALLSLVCQGLNQKRKAQKKAAFDEALLTGTGQSIVADFYERSMRDLPERVHRFIENELITERGFRKPCDLDDARSLHGMTDGDLRLLENRRLLRIEPQHGTERVELIHDLLTRVVRQHRDVQREREKLEKRRRDQRQKLRSVVTVGVIILLTILSGAGMLVSVYSQKARLAEEQINNRTQEENVRLKKRAKADSLLQDGENRRRSGKYEDSLQFFENAVDSYRELGERKGQMSALIDVGDVFALTGSFQNAESTYTQAVSIARQEDERDLEGKALESLASLNEREGRLQQALKYYEEANRIYQSGGDSQATGRVLERLAFEAEKSHSLGKAATLYQDALKSYKDSGDELGQLRVQQAIGRVTGYWGFLVDLLSGQTYELKTDTVNVGRNVEGVSNDISVSNQMVSRRHLAISRDLHIDDLRSRNGTTINARLLPYGIGAKLSDQDIIVLGNVEPLQFRLQKPPAPLKVPPDTWAIFIDSESKSCRYMTSSEYFLTLDNGKLLLKSGSSESGVLKLRGGKLKPQMFMTKSDWQTMTTLKETDYEYKSYILNTGVWLDLYDIPIDFVKLTADGKNISLRGPAFQIVLVNSPPP